MEGGEGARKRKKKKALSGVSLWCSRLRIQSCHCSSQVTAVVWVPSLAWELSQATDTAKKKKEKKSFLLEMFILPLAASKGIINVIFPLVPRVLNICLWHRVFSALGDTWEQHPGSSLILSLVCFLKASCLGESRQETLFGLCVC